MLKESFKEQNNFSYSTDTALFHAENISCAHFFTTRNTDLSSLPFNVVQAEKQIHSAEVIYIDNNNKNDAFFCDGFVMSKSSYDGASENFGIAIRTADCVPILMYEPINHVAAAVHAGWRGTVGKPSLLESGNVPGIAAQAVRIMEEHGAEKNIIQVAIGAAIHSCCFEVKEDFLTAVRDSVGNIADKFIYSKSNHNETCYYYDLPGLNAYLLCNIGINKNSINIGADCTACDPNTFFSFRKEGTLNGTLMAAVKP